MSLAEHAGPNEGDAAEDRPPRRAARLLRLVPWLALALGAVTVGLTYDDYGATFDEGVQARYGELALRYFASGGQDESCNSFLDLYLYGPLVEMLPALWYDADEPGKYEVRHLFLGLLAVLSIPAVWVYGRLFGDARVAVFAVIAVATLPRFYGHWFNNPKDLPFAVAMLWFMVTLGALFTDARIRWRRVVWCGVAMGLTLCARPGGFPLVVLFLGGGALTWLATRERGEGERAGWMALRPLLPRLLVVCAIAWSIMVAFWPWAHESVLLRPLEAMRVAASFATTVPVLFEGITVQSDALPWYYVAKYVLIGTPLPVLALALLGLTLGVRDQLAPSGERRSRMMALTQMWFFAPIVLFAIVRPNIYGGMRHFLFVLPALGVLAANGAVGILRLVPKARGRAVAWALLLVVLLLPVRDLVRLHPYQMTYYNVLVGGVAGASDDYWTDYYLSSYREAIVWVNERAARSPELRFEVVIAGGPAVLLWAEDYTAPNVELVSLRTVTRTRAALAPADFYIGTSRLGRNRFFPDAPIVHTIGRDGAVFTVVRGSE